jgi:hypothetical protein
MTWYTDTCDIMAMVKNVNYMVKNVNYISFMVKNVNYMRLGSNGCS